jgi:hypothetical protein
MAAYSAGRRRPAPTPVSLLLYDLSPANDYLWAIGCGLHHSGVEISGVEYSFASGAGIFESTTPTIVNGAKFRTRIDLGSFDGGSAQLKQVLHELRDSFAGDSYHLIRRNCNHFASALVWRLLHRKIPSYVNRVSELALCVSCLLPKQLLEHAPVGDPNDRESSSSFFASNKTMMSPSSTVAFSGTGRTLVDASSERQGLLARGSSETTTSSADDLTDRRERARKAALARFEQSQQQQDAKQS